METEVIIHPPEEDGDQEALINLIAQIVARRARELAKELKPQPQASSL